MLNVYALTAHPAVRTTLQLAQEEHKTKGFRAVFGVILMFLILCGGIWMLLQSSFGPKQAYLISGTAFWGCWLVLSLIWLTGVPGIGPLGIPRSTPKYYGPQGAEAAWEVAGPHGPTDLRKKFDRFATSKDGKDAFITVDEKLTAASSDKASAEAAATQVVSEEYAVDLGVGAADITVPNVIEITQTQLARDDGRYRYAKVTFDAAPVTATDTKLVKDIKGRIQPKTITLVLDPGSLGTPTKYAIGIFAALFLLHLVMLVVYELNRVPQPQGVPERTPVAV